jgi:hypothetical protein
LFQLPPLSVKDTVWRDLVPPADLDLDVLPVTFSVKPNQLKRENQMGKLKPISLLDISESSRSG